MACFLVPAAEAVVTTIAAKVLEKKEKEADAGKQTEVIAAESIKERWSGRLKRLNYLLWGGAGLLAFEHLWHGEIQPFFPFLTAAADPGETAEMLHEMSTVGVSMAVIVTAVWAVVTVVSGKIRNRAEAETYAKEVVKQ